VIIDYALRDEGTTCHYVPAEFWHVTNTKGLADQNFEKGEADGTADALELLETVAAALTT